MKFRQLIYTSYKGFGENPETTGYYARTPGISDSDAKQIADLFSRSETLLGALAKYPDAETLDTEALSEVIPKRYAFLKLSSGSYCWCVTSVVPRRFGESFGVIYFHALVSEKMPEFSPIAVFDCMEFSTALDDDRFNGIVPPTPLSAIEMEDSDFAVDHEFSDNTLTMYTAERCISAIRCAVAKRKQLILGTDRQGALPLFKELFKYLPAEDTAALSFSTLTDPSDIKRFTVNCLGADVDLGQYMKHKSYIVADTTLDRYSSEVSADKFASVMTQLVYTDIQEYDRFCDFLAQYKSRFTEYDIELVLRIYYFIYTDRYLEFSSDIILNILDDKSFGYVDKGGVTEKIEAYIASGADREHILEVYARLYRFSDDKADVLDRVVDICFNDIILCLDVKRQETYRAFLESNFDAALYAEIVKRYDRYSHFILKDIAKEHVFTIVISILKDNLPRECSALASRMFTEVYAAVDALSPTAVRDALLPAVTFNKTLFDYCVDGLYDSASVSFDEIIEWLLYCERSRDTLISDTFVALAVNDLIGERIFGSVVNDKQCYTSAVAALGKLVVNPRYEGYVDSFADRIIEAQGTVNVPDRLIMLLGIYKWDVKKFVALLGKIRQRCGEELFTSIVYIYTKTEGVDFVRNISDEFGDVALRIVSHNVQSVERYVDVYIRQFFNSGKLTSDWQELFETVTANATPDGLADAVIEVLKAVHTQNDSPIVTYMCKRFNDSLWHIDHTNRPFISEALAIVRSDMTPESNLSEVRLFSDLLKWEGEGRAKERTIGSIFNVINLALSSQEKCLFVCKYYIGAIVAMSKVSFKKRRDPFLLKVLLIYAQELSEQIWDRAYKKERRRFRTKVVLTWLDYSAYVVTNKPGFRSPLIARIFSDMKPGEFMRLYKKAGKKGLHHVIAQMKSYFDSLPEKTQNKVAPKLLSEI